MTYRQLAATLLCSSLLSSVLGSGVHGQDDPISGLLRRGINDARVNELTFSPRGDETCHCALACDVLVDTFGPEHVSVFGEAAYDAGLGRFWSQQQSQTRPRCFVHPTDAEDVAVVLLLARATQCPFAVKGGGHSSFKGCSNSDGGITIDFFHMKQVTPSADRKTVSIGPGNAWVDVYSVLEPQNLTVVGGRVASVGVGGFLLGGGISFSSNEHGWACDNVVSYEVVLASGEVVEVNAGSYPDLFWALRGGGGGNFGVVTRFDVNAFERGLMWGGSVIYEFQSSREASIDAVVRYAAEDASSKDPKSHMIVSFAYAQIYGMWITATQVDHADPHPEGEHPEVFDDFFLENPLSSDIRTNSQSNLTIAVDATSPFGQRESLWALTVRVDKQLVKDAVSIWEEEVTPLQNVTGIMPALSIQVLSPAQREGMNRNGGNPLGLGASKETLIHFTPNVAWTFDSDDDLVLTAYHNFYTRTKTLARERGLDHPFLCMYYDPTPMWTRSAESLDINYASHFQDPFAGYGAENAERLVQISEKYDPTGVFQKLHPGFFKLRGGPPAVLQSKALPS